MQKNLLVAVLVFSVLLVNVNAIEAANNWGFGPCAIQHNTQYGIRNGSSACFPAVEMTQGRYCDAKGAYTYNCMGCNNCISGYYCSPETSACTRCDAGEACFAEQEIGLLNSAGDFLQFIPSMFPLMLIFAVGLLAFWLLDMLRHINEYV